MSIRKLAFALSVKSEIYTLAPVIMKFSKLNYPYSIIDISEEKGWFDKGKQYLSLDYPKPTVSIGFEPSNIEEMRESLTEFLLDNEIELVVVSGVSLGSLLTVSTCSNIGIPTVKIDAGVRSYEVSDKKEQLRQLIDRFTSIYLTSLPTSTKNLLDEGANAETIFLTGHPIADLVIKYVDHSLKSSDILDELDIERNKYLLMYIDEIASLHLLDEIIKFSQKAELPLIVPLTSELMKRLEDEDKNIKYMMDYDVLFIESLDYIDHLSLLYHAKQIFTDIDIVAIESSVLNKKCIFIGSGYYRNELLEGGWITNYNKSELSIEVEAESKGSSIQLLGGGEAAENIAEKILNMKIPPKHRGYSSFLYIKEGDKLKEYSEALTDEWKPWIG
jgi:UDP-N-acetylglucosamine 2-epimerase